MRDYKHILLWENLFRLKRLISFRKLVLNYFQLAKYDWKVEGRIENDKAKQLRSKINQRIESVSSFVKSSRVITTLVWSPPPAIGGSSRSIHLIQNIFNLGDFHISYDAVINNLDNAIGVYKSDIVWSIFRIINPFFYFNLLFTWISNLPFLVIGKMGFNRDKAESSNLGRLIKLIIYVLTVAASSITIVEYFGGWNNVLNWLKDNVSKIIG